MGSKNIKNIINKAIQQKLFTYREVKNLIEIIKLTSNLKGAIAEVGVFKGYSAYIIASYKKNKKLYLFDSFEGNLKVSVSDKYDSLRKFHSTSLIQVKNCLKEFNNIYIYKGWFPQTARAIQEEVFSFVHLDTDLYQSTIDCLNFFYPRMIKKGIILSHDYNESKHPGVKLAFNEFLKDKKVIPIVLPNCSQIYFYK